MFMTTKEIRIRARKKLKDHCRVCRVCNGRSCAGEVPGMGSLGTGASFGNNLESLARHKLAMRVIHDVTDPDPGVTVLGYDLAVPILAAPIGGISFNMGGVISEEEYVTSVLAGCRDRGTLGCTGDGVPGFITDTANMVLRRLDGHGIPFIKPWESDELETKITQALDAGAKVIGMDVDAAGLVTLRQMGRPVAPRSVEVLKRLIADTPARFVLKGILTVDDARRAVDTGAAAIVVSNHGGRVLDHAPGAAEVLPAIAEAVGDQIQVLADGGVRTGVDVLKYLALGARAVLVGRPVARAAIAGATEGVQVLLDELRTELKSAMVLTGCARASDAGPHLLC